MITTYFCKKGGVGKTTILGEHADYLASQGKKVLIISIDDQNSIFELFGKTSLVFENEGNYIEHYLVDSCKKEDALIQLRENIYGIKTLNIDMLSNKLTLERQFEKNFIKKINELAKDFDATFIDLPPSSNRATELILSEICNFVCLIVQLNKLGVNGFFNTLQYFIDCSIELEKIKYILPNGFSKNKSVPSVALEEMKAISKENVPHAKFLEPVPERSVVQTLQSKGIAVFDNIKGNKNISNYVKTQKKEVSELFVDLFKKIK